MPPKGQNTVPKAEKNLTENEWNRRENLCAYLALGWAPTVTASALGSPHVHVPVTDLKDIADAKKSGNNNPTRVGNFCAIQALAISLHAVRKLNEGGNINYITPEDILAIFQNRDRWTAEYQKRLAEFAADEDIIAAFEQPDFLEVEQISLLLDLINEDYGLNYRLGHVTQNSRSPAIEDNTGPIVWMGQYGHGSEAHVSIFIRRTPCHRASANELT